MGTALKSFGICLNFLYRHLFTLKNAKVIRSRILEVAQYTNKPVKEVQALFHKPNLVDQAWDKTNPKTERDILQFYAETTAYIYADIRWNVMDPSKYNSRFVLLDFCKEQQIHEILDYGASVGEYCIFLAQNGFRVAYCDVYGKTWKFAEWRFKIRNLDICMLKVADTLSEQYDLIICTDVLEHVKNPPALLRKLYAALKPSGFLVATWCFTGGGKHLEENEKYATTIFEILEKIGYRRVGENYFHFLQKLGKD